MWKSKRWRQVYGVGMVLLVKHDLSLLCSQAAPLARTSLHTCENLRMENWGFIHSHESSIGLSCTYVPSCFGVQKGALSTQ